MQPLSNFVNLADIDNAIQTGRIRDLEMRAKQFQLSQLQDQARREAAFRDVIRRNTDPGAPAREYDDDGAGEFMGAPLVPGKNLASLARPPSVNENAIFAEGAAIDPAMAMNLKSKMMGMRKEELEYQNKLFEQMGRSADEVRSGPEGYATAIKALPESFSSRLPVPGSESQNDRENLAKVLRSRAVPVKDMMDFQIKLAALAKKTEGSVKPPEHYRWGPPDENGNPTLVPITGGKEERRLNEIEIKKTKEDANLKETIDIIDQMINDVRTNPIGTATPLAPVARGIASVKGIFDPTGEPSTAIGFTQRRDKFIALSKAILARDGNMSNQDRNRLENAIGTVKISTPANAEESLTTLKNLLIEIRSSAKGTKRLNQESSYPAGYLERRKQILGE